MAKKKKKSGEGIGALLKEKKFLAIGIVAFIIITLVLSIVFRHTSVRHETITEMMKDAVLHEEGKINLFGLFSVNPAMISGLIVSAFLILLAIVLRVFFIPKFKVVKPGKFQLVIEMWVGFFANLAKNNSHDCHELLGGYVFTAGSYIFVGTIIELLGLQGVTFAGHSIALPAVLADINSAIQLGVTTYLVIMAGGVVKNGLKGLGSVAKDFSLPISMSFRLFGAMLSGVLVTELVYYIMFTSFIVPVLVGVLFTAIHSLVQTYVLCMLCTFYFGEATEQKPKKKKEKKSKNNSEIEVVEEAAVQEV